MTATPDLAARYLAAWNETDPAARRAAVDELFSADVRYTDPLADVTGRDALDATIAAVQGQFPGFVFTLAGPVDAHHDQLRFPWILGPEGQEAPIAGVDVALTDDAGRIRAVLGFLDRVPAAV
ncbi:nuclear transport factor 2 family protein [Geodermatophilus sp. CPCC 206100]|uniref:nuclear transport factor 2 family protein n=1 Tax=Geodermatophilus sp. CPCC 206100 TaxID=3020054 RepID=UPI003AFFE39C